MYPVPKTVATLRAHNGAAGPGREDEAALIGVRSSVPEAASELVVTVCPGLPRRIVGFSRRVLAVDRRGDHVSAAGPLAQVNHPATLAAEGELRVLAPHQLAAGWTTQCRRAFHHE